MNSRERIFGVVLPVPGPLSRLADKVRRSYDPNFPFIGPHVTVLPPRPLGLTRREVQDAVQRVARRTAPIPLRVGKVASFHPVMPVVFLGFLRGAEELSRLHRRLARVPLRGRETFPYVPHVTLGQDLDEPRLATAMSLTRKLIGSSRSSRAWLATSLVVVERCSRRRWISLDPVPLSAPSRREAGHSPSARRP